MMKAKEKLHENMFFTDSDGHFENANFFSYLGLKQTKQNTIKQN